MTDAFSNGFGPARSTSSDDISFGSQGANDQIDYILNKSPKANTFQAAQIFWDAPATEPTEPWDRTAVTSLCNLKHADGSLADNVHALICGHHIYTDSNAVNHCAANCIISSTTNPNLPPPNTMPFLCWDCILADASSWEFSDRLNGRPAQPYAVTESRVIRLFDTGRVDGWPQLLTDAEIVAEHERLVARQAARDAEILAEMSMRMDVDGDADTGAGASRRVFQPGYPENSQSLVAFAPGTAPSLTMDQVREVRREKMRALRARLQTERDQSARHIEGFESEREIPSGKKSHGKRRSRHIPIAHMPRGIAKSGAKSRHGHKSRSKSAALTFADRLEFPGSNGGSSKGKGRGS